jgi:hypothetical protein
MSSYRALDESWCSPIKPVTGMSVRLHASNSNSAALIGKASLHPFLSISLNTAAYRDRHEKKKPHEIDMEQTNRVHSTRDGTRDSQRPSQPGVPRTCRSGTRGRGSVCLPTTSRTESRSLLSPTPFLFRPVSPGRTIDADRWSSRDLSECKMIDMVCSCHCYRFSHQCQPHHCRN